ncbi:MAG: bifunctional 23S rRNA (guanine(2069)-N(7))-methyltransferase RlmK/23S rRNA (guanine(2445)-N(2))-methyltransferase RlmL, partial [Spirochaetales bacterium]|nr:bifunctional 23S rRNA (guanine(2069)-N(7))-methyltransferase RlmK/23S rRNA (guanine(2445)-N(2))-methyltransferase RlmL [Spirochaetales bacterium]
NRSAVYAARDNVRNAGFDHAIRLYTGDARDLHSLRENFSNDGGLVIFNPPYGERLGDAEQLIADYTRIGSELKKYFNGWNCSVMSSSRNLIDCLSMTPYKKNKLYNGGLLVYLSHFEISKPGIMDEKEQSGIDMFRNRLAKKSRQLKSWLETENISCYRLYDADMPEYAVAIDIYEHKWIHLQEYAPPKTIEPKAARKRLGHVMSVLPAYCAILPENIFYKQRRKQSGNNQYSGMSDDSFRVKIHEDGLRFYIDLKRYLDTGIFLDHRKTRQYIRSLARSRVFLNLFAYTGTASVYAAKGGARATYTVDTSATYLDWAAENFHLNDIKGKQHQCIRKDSMAFLKETTDRFDLVFIDPPTFSNSKSRTDTFSVQDDYIELINSAVRVCNPGAIILFSTNFRKFSFDTTAIHASSVEEITARTVSPDFLAAKNGHRCWEIRL